MKRLLAVVLLCAVALGMSASVAAAAGFHWARPVQLTWQSDSTYTNLCAGATIGYRYSDPISVPDNLYMPTPADSTPQFIIWGSVGTAGGASDSLDLETQWSYDATNWIPSVTWNKDDQVLVGAGTYFTYRQLRATGHTPADLAGGTGNWAAGVPNTYGWEIQPYAARAFRVLLHPGNAKASMAGVRVWVRFPVVNP